MRICVLALTAMMLLAGCAGGASELRRAQAVQVAVSAAWVPLVFNSSAFSLAGFAPPSLEQSNTLRVYIEGDGLAWINRFTPSFDPTPNDPIGLKLALADLSGEAVYLARPCQYISSPKCSNKYWTSHRFSSEVIMAINEAIDQLKTRYQAQQIIFIGYSGGGAIAALLAARRKDVRGLITVAGNLDPEYWARQQKISQLSGSLSPVDVWEGLLDIPQIHWAGAEDRVVQKEVGQSFANHFPLGERPLIVVMQQYDHNCCWLRQWPKMLEQSFSQMRPPRRRGTG